jgi:hypothetical protein
MLSISLIICPWEDFPTFLMWYYCLLGPCINYKENEVFWIRPQRSEAIFTTLIFLHNLQMGLLSLSFCPWKALPASCNVTLAFFGLWYEQNDFCKYSPRGHIHNTSSLQESTPKRCSTQLGSSLSRKHYTRLNRYPKEKWNTVQVLPSSIGSWPYLQTLDKAMKDLTGKNTHKIQW